MPELTLNAGVEHGSHVNGSLKQHDGFVDRLICLHRDVGMQPSLQAQETPLFEATALFLV
jgi:hypothetical protein